MWELSSAARLYPGLGRLMCAALADAALAAQLVRDPGETTERIAATIELTAAEQMLASAVHGAVDIYDYAAQLHENVQQAQLEKS